MEALLRDIKYGVRLLLQNPGVTIIAVLSLALGIGANTAMFSWANALILTPIRVAYAESLVRVYTTHPGGFDEGSLSWPDFEDLRQNNDVFTDMAAFAPSFVSFTEGEGTERIGASLPLFDTGTMSEHVGNALLLQRLTTGVFGTFGSLALLLAGVGLYGVMAFTVAQRTREIGIRVALGADGAAVRRLVLKKSMSLALVGLAIGLALGLGLAVLIAGTLYDVSPFDPLALGGSTITILAVAFVASYLPALRATRIDPMVALRT